MMIKSYKDLSPEEELELVLWLGFLEDSIDNALVQKQRWEHSRNAWDLKAFFVAVALIDDAILKLKRVLSCDEELWGALSFFKKKVKKYKLRDLRNDIVHRERLFKLQDKKGNPLAVTLLFILGGYSQDNDEYVFGPHTIKLSEAFGIVQALSQSIGTILNARLKSYYETKEYDGIVPFTYLRSFERRRNNEQTHKI